MEDIKANKTDVNLLEEGGEKESTQLQEEVNSTNCQEQAENSGKI